MASIVRTRSGAPVSPHTPVCRPYPGTPPSPRPPAPTCPERSALRASPRTSTAAMASLPPVTHSRSPLHAPLKRPRSPATTPGMGGAAEHPAGTLRPGKMVPPYPRGVPTPGVPPHLPFPEGWGP